MRKRKHFTPDHLSQLDNSLNCAMTHLSSSFFKVGNELLTSAKREVIEKDSNYDHSSYCFPAIMMFCTAFEAYINENIGFSKALTLRKDENSKDIVLEKIREIENASEIKEKIKLFYAGYDITGKGIDTNSHTFQNVIALFKLRNEIVHYSPEMIEISQWPIRLKEAFKKSNPKMKINTHWTTTFNTVSVAEWAHDTIVEAIRLFSKSSGCQDPFGEETPYPWHWEKER